MGLASPAIQPSIDSCSYNIVCHEEIINHYGNNLPYSLQASFRAGLPAVDIIQLVADLGEYGSHWIGLRYKS